MSISRADISDIPEVHALVQNSFRGELSRKGWTSEADFFDGNRTTIEALHNDLSAPNAAMLKYTDQSGTIIGCVYTIQKRKSNSTLPLLYVGMLSVHPELQSRGIGKKLMKATEDLARELGCFAVQINCIDARKSLMSWYERQGYRPTGELMPCHEPNVTLGFPKIDFMFVMMEKPV